MIDAQVQTTRNGAILYDARHGIVTPQWFDPEGRAMRPAPAGGRGAVSFVDTPAGTCALRHYRRGGLVARLVRSRYVWAGAERTRAFREFRLLARLVELDLPVPAPVAARYERHGFSYSADLLTRRIEGARTLAQMLDAATSDLGERIGETIARFHAAGVWHADLNAHNVLIDDRNAVWLLDFDRGRMRPPRKSWRCANLGRLDRSLRKLGAGDIAGFETRFWCPLVAAYRSRFRTEREASQ